MCGRSGLFFEHKPLLLLFLPPVAPIDHVYGTLGPIKATATQQYADISKLREEIEGKGSFTMFAPSNEAWELLDPVSNLAAAHRSRRIRSNTVFTNTRLLRLPQEQRSALVSNVNIELYNALHYHMVNRRLLTKDMKNGMTFTSMYNDLGLYINHYSNGVSLCTVV